MTHVKGEIWTEAELEEMRRLHFEERWTFQEIADHHNITKQRVFQLMGTWKWRARPGRKIHGAQ